MQKCENNNSKENNEESIEIIINNKESNGYQSNKEELKEEKCKCEYKPTRNYKTLCMKHKHEVDGKDNSGFINCRNNILVIFIKKEMNFMGKDKKQIT